MSIVVLTFDFSEGVNWWEVREFLLVKDVTGSTRGELSAVTIGALLQNVKFKTVAFTSSRVPYNIVMASPKH